MKITRKLEGRVGDRVPKEVQNVIKFFGGWCCDLFTHRPIANGDPHFSLLGFMFCLGFLMFVLANERV